MKRKYYLRGLGIGIIVTTIVLAISFSQREVDLSDEEIIARATQLGMVMQEEETDTAETEETTTQQEITQPEQTTTQPEDTTLQTEETESQPEDVTETEVTPDEEAMPETEAVQDSEEQSEDVTAEQPTSGNYRLVIKKGDVCRVVCETLAANGIISDAEAFRKYLFEIGYASNMSVGQYDIPYGLTQEEVAAILKAGPIGE